jgi:hypothetical protein
MVTTHKIVSLSFDRDHLYIELDDRLVKVELEKVSAKLKNADDVQRMIYRISLSGYGIHWPLIDEDLSVDALIRCA